MPTVPDWMRDNFRRGLQYHEDGKSGSGIVPRTVAEARQAVNQGDLPSTKPKRMAAWFARHMVDLDSAPKRGDDDYPSPGQVAHMLWGGGATKPVSERAMLWAQAHNERAERNSSADSSIMFDVDEQVEENSDAPELPETAVIVVAVEGEETADGRYVEPGALSWREPPLSLTVNHDDNQRAGRIDAIMRVETLNGLGVSAFAKDDDKDDRGYGTGPIVVGLVTFNLDTDFGRQVAAEVRDGFLTGVSMEVGDEVVEYDDEGVMHLIEGRIGAVTLAPFQAIESAKVVLVAGGHVWSVSPPVISHDGLRLLSEDALVAASVPTAPPGTWFSNPSFDGPSGLVVEDTGRVYGHLALWDTCHTARNDVCVTPPSSATGYAYYRTGYVQTEEGESVATGAITLGTGHASTRPNLSAADAVAHYEHTGHAVADVACGHDEHGIWVAGALRPDVTEKQIRELRGASLSGDWRAIGGNLELVAALAVNVPGFPVPRVQAGLAASGRQTALVAAGHTDDQCGDHDLETRLSRLESIIEVMGFTNSAIERLSTRLMN